MPKRKVICPRCGSSNGVKIVYGYPSSKMWEEAERGEISLGGCCVSPNDPTRCCNDCDYNWGGNPLESFVNLKSIKAFIGGHFGPSYLFVADFSIEIVTYQFFKDTLDEPSIVERKPLTTEVWKKIIKGLKNCDLIYWLDEYKNHNVIDGTNWYVELVFDSGQIIEKNGSNQYPGRWKPFCRLISTTVGNKFA